MKAYKYLLTLKRKVTMLMNSHSFGGLLLRPTTFAERVQWLLLRIHGTVLVAVHGSRSFETVGVFLHPSINTAELPYL